MINKKLNNVDAALNQDTALMAGGSRPMHQGTTFRVDPLTGMPMQGNAPNMGNFGGAMANSNIPMYDQSMSPGAIAQSRAEKIKNIKNIGAGAQAEANMISSIEQYRSCKKK